MKDSLQRCVTNGLGELQRVTLKVRKSSFITTGIDHVAKAGSLLYWSKIIYGINCKLDG